MAQHLLDDAVAGGAVCFWQFLCGRVAAPVISQRQPYRGTQRPSQIALARSGQG